MRRSVVSSSRRGRKSPRREPRVSPRPDSSTPAYEADDEQRAQLWDKLRQGARNVAGVTWQLAVSLHVLVQSRAGDLPFTTLVPEGFEDLDCRTAAGSETLVQIKEVSAGAGQLATSRLCDAITHAAHATSGPIVVVTDGELSSGLWFTGWVDALGAQIERCAALVEALGGRGLSLEEASALLGRVHLVSLPWNLREQTESLIVRALGVHPTVAAFTLSMLYESMGAASADQRHLTLDQARTLRVGDVDAALSAVQSAVDVSGLDAAVAAGVCRPADFSANRATSAKQFYLGVDGVPGHIDQGFDVVRANEMDQLTQAAAEERYALITGPSGSGKSVLLWRAARDVILGARVVRVARVASEADASLLVRHIELLRPTDTSPVVVAADNLGRPGASAWMEAVARLLEIPHVVIVGAAREEDFTPHLLTGGPRVIRPRLDRPTAELIAARVERAEFALKMSPTEAFARSDGLLMEYLSLLREGQHLEQVLAVQAADLATPGRELQREAARLVLSAHAVGLALSSRMLAEALAEAGSASAVGDALATLKLEHVILESDDVWTGLHELRSQALTGLLHESPPPTLGETLAVVARQLSAAEAGWLLRRAAERFPSVALNVAGALSAHACAPGATSSEVAELLEGAERADNAAYAAACLPIIQANSARGVSPVTIAPMVFAIRNQGSPFDPIGVAQFDSMAARLHLIASGIPARTSAVAEAVAADLDEERVVQLCIGGSMADCVRLLEALAGVVVLSSASADAIYQAFDEPRDAAQAGLWSRLIEALDRFVPAADRSELFGTTEHRAALIARCEPSAVALTIRSDADPSLTVMRELYAQDRLTEAAWDAPVPGSRDELNDFVVAIARQLASACPEASKVEVITITPSGRRFRLAGHEPGHKDMPRDAFKERVGVRRNVGFQGAIRMLAAAPTWTALVMEQAKLARALETLAIDAPFRLRSNDQPSARSDWEARVQELVRQTGELAARPADRSASRAESHARQDGTQRADDAVSSALYSVAQALSNLLTNDNHVAAAISIREAAAKVEQAQSSAPATYGLDEPIPDALSPTLHKLASAAISASAAPEAWRTVRFGDHERVDAIVATAADEARGTQQAILSAIESTSPTATLQQVPDPRPFPSSIDRTSWLVTVPLEDWDNVVQALAALDADTRGLLECNVWALAVVGATPLPLAVLMTHYGDEPLLPLAGESLESHLSAAGLRLPEVAGAAVENIANLTSRMARASWEIALHRLRPADWARATPAPTSEDLAELRLEARRAAIGLPNPVRSAIEDAFEVLADQVELELAGTSDITLAGELLDVLDGGPSSQAVEAGLWQALTTLSLAPVLEGETVDAKAAD